MFTGNACLHGRAFCVFGAIPPVGNSAKIRTRGRGGLLESMCRNLTRPSLSHGKAQKPTLPLGLLHGEARKPTLPLGLLHGEARKPTLPLGLLHGEARKPTSPLGLLHGEARKRRAAAFRRGTRGRAAAFRRGTRGGAGRRPSGGAHGAGPCGAKRLLHMRVRRACPFCAYPKRRKNYGVCYLAFLPAKSDECVAGRKRRRSPPRSRRRGREKPPGKGATP